MVFPFTFNFSVPGIINPFASHQQPQSSSKSSEVGHATNLNSTSGYVHVSAPAYSHQTPGTSSPPSSYSSRSTSYPIPIPSVVNGARLTRAQLPKIPRRPSPSPTSSSCSSLRPLTLSRKRGWEPSLSDSVQSLTESKSSSTATVTLASTTGYLDTPSKYRQVAYANEDITMSDELPANRRDEYHHDEDAPPLKKRRGLAGSIVSTALSAAVIGTAVGLTVYRLWRDRGKDGQFAQANKSSSIERSQGLDQQPPPPYHPGDWRSIEQPPALVVRSPSVPPTPRASGKSKKAPQRRAVNSHHSTRRTRQVAKPLAASAIAAPRTQPEFDFGRQVPEVNDTQTEVEDQMDWIGDKLSKLIEEGRRALQAEVVVMSEAKEDEVDDGSGTWEEEGGDDDTSSRHSRSSSVKGFANKTRPPPIGLGIHGVHTSSPYAYRSLSSSPRKAAFSPLSSPTKVAGGFASSSVPTSGAFNNYGAGFAPRPSTDIGGMGLPTPMTSTFSEDPVAWESPELRESMERARARMLAKRGGLGV